MLLYNFRYKLRKCNPRLFIDVDSEAHPFGYNEYPTAGLYLKEENGSTKFIMGVPHIDVPEYTIAAVNFNELAMAGRFEEISKIKETGLALGKERIIWRGWRSIVGNLIRMKYISKNRAKKVFNTYFDDDRPELPRTYINKDI